VRMRLLLKRYVARGETFHSKIYKLSSIRNNGLCSEKSSTVFTKIVIKLNIVNYQGTTVLSTTYKILPNILLSRLTPYVDKIIKDHQCSL
jgi:hypothetical protein